MNDTVDSRHDAGAWRQAVALVIALAICFAASAIGATFTAMSVGTWYQELVRPSFAPPDWVFGPVWTALYAAMAVALWLVWRHEPRDRSAYAIFGIQLGLNVLWSALFFGLRSPGLALIEILVLLAAIVVTIVVFWRRSKLAGALLLPYAVWVAFAAVLNAALWRLN